MRARRRSLVQRVTGARGTLSRTQIAFVGLVLVTAAAVSVLAVTFSPLTVTLDATTECLAWDVEAAADGRPYVVDLPSGGARYYELRETPEGEFEDAPVDVELSAAATIVLHGDGRLRVTRRSVGEVELVVGPASAEAEGFRVELFETGRPVLELSDTLTYVTRCHEVSTGTCRGRDYPFRAFVRGRRIMVGDHPVERVTPDVEDPGEGLLVHSCALRGGRLRAFDSAWLYGTRYRVTEEVLDLGDVVTLGPSGESSDESLVWGSVSASFDDDTSLGDALHVVAHSAQRRVAVRRHGGGFTFGATAWEVVASQPLLQAAWVTMVSALLLCSGFASLLDIRAGLGDSALGDDEPVEAEIEHPDTSSEVAA